MQISCGFVLGGLSDKCQDTRLETLGDSAMTSWGEATWGIPPSHHVCVPPWRGKDH